jgi:hypothetical protein
MFQPVDGVPVLLDAFDNSKEEEEEPNFLPEKHQERHCVLLQMRAKDPARYDHIITKPQLEPFSSAFGKFNLQLSPAYFLHDSVTGRMTFLVPSCTTFTMLAWCDRANYALLEALLQGYYEIVFASETHVTSNVTLALADYEHTRTSE